MQGGRPRLATGGACLAGVVVLAHAVALATRIGRALPSRLGATVWFYPAASAALLAGMGLGLWVAGGVAGDGDAWRALRLAHVHLNVFGWVGLAVVGTQFSCGRRCCGPGWWRASSGRSAGPCRRSRSAWSSGGRGRPSLPAPTGALTYLLPVAFGRGAFGNRKLSGILNLAWPLRVAAINLGVTLLAAWPAGEWVSAMGWWLASLGLGSFVPLAAAALIASHLRTEEAT